MGMTPETERAAIVRWLRETAEKHLKAYKTTGKHQHIAASNALSIAIYAIERGDHIKETSDDN